MNSDLGFSKLSDLLSKGIIKANNIEFVRESTKMAIDQSLGAAAQRQPEAIELIGLPGLFYNQEEFPLITRVNLVKMLMKDEYEGVPAIASSFVSGMTFDCNSGVVRTSGLSENLARQINNVNYHIPSEYLRYAGGCIRERGERQIYSYIAFRAGTGLKTRYKVEAFAFRLEGQAGLFRYARNIEHPESVA